MPTEHSFYADNLVDALLEAGIPPESILELDGWKLNEQGYYWTDPDTDEHHGYDGVASCHLNHHTATSGYTPYVKNSSGQTKANVWGGMLRGDRLYMEGDGIPTLAIASAGPADYSAGQGRRQYIKDCRDGKRVLDENQPDDVPTFYGNRYSWNTEWICDGVGGRVEQDMWDLIVVYNAALATLHDGNEAFDGFHAGFTPTRKIDYRDGRYRNANETIVAIWAGVVPLLGADAPPPVIPEPERPMIEQGRSRAEYPTAKDADLRGMDVEYWQNIILQCVEGVLDAGNSTKTFFYDTVEADKKGLTWRVWDEAFTLYFSAWTGRNSYGLGPSERKILDHAYTKLIVNG